MVEEEIKEFIGRQQSLYLACSVIHEQAQVSYAPFIYNQQKQEFYIYISKLADHGKCLPANKTVSVMLIEDEHNCRNIFARKRLNYLCSVSPVSRNSIQWKDYIEKFKQQFGKIMELLSQFNDFDMYSLKPKSGSYVKGFGKAYQIRNGQITHLDANNIKSKLKG